MTNRKIEEALKKFKLIQGVGDGKTTACASSALAWVSGDNTNGVWNDSLPCGHPIIRNLIVAANDSVGSSEKSREEIVRVGEKGAIDTWWVPGIVIAWALAQTPRGASAQERVILVMNHVAEWKSKKVKVRPDLTGADLTGADLRSADLTGADLRGADLTGAVLRGADLTGAYLTGADLTGAVLRGADLTGAYLRSADLTGADLTGAVLTGAYLRSANLTGAYGDAKTSGLSGGWKVSESGLIVKEGAS